MNKPRLRPDQRASLLDVADTFDAALGLTGTSNRIRRFVALDDAGERAIGSVLMLVIEGFALLMVVPFLLLWGRR